MNQYFVICSLFRNSCLDLKSENIILVFGEFSTRFWCYVYQVNYPSLSNEPLPNFSSPIRLLLIAQSVARHTVQRVASNCSEVSAKMHQGLSIIDVELISILFFTIQIYH